VRIEIEGPGAALDRFHLALRNRVPRGLVWDEVIWEPLPVQRELAFQIRPSLPGGEPAFPVAADLATCGECLRELWDPTNRRYRYPFISCATCGPRLTILREIPYDRSRTTMASFPLCPACQAEYDNPADRRFHAQTISCPACGPRLQWLCERGERQDAVDPLVAAAQAIRRGQIVAVKGLGGFHLVCSAVEEGAVQRLRQRKGRDAKPLAIMLADLEQTAAYAQLDDVTRAYLASPAAPIVLLRRRRHAEGPVVPIAPSVAPDTPYLGVMLPYTPLHHLLVEAVGRLPLVVTSGNRQDEPIATTDEEALAALSGIADGFLTHDRPITVRCDDAVVQVVAGRPAWIRSSRGLAPLRLTLPLPAHTPALLAAGGQLKSTFALGRGTEAIVSHHLGDLDSLAAQAAYARDIATYEAMFRFRPAVLAHDLHPDYASTHYCLQRGRDEGITCIAVQHHHAHIASCLAEHGLCGPAIGVAWDGTGYGTDGAIWGGEFLIADLNGFRRAAHLRYVRLPGGDLAIRQIWRCAAAYLLDAGLPLDALAGRVAASHLRLVERMIQRGVHAPRTSSAGRLFDAVAALLGLRTEVQHEAQAAQQLQWLAEQADDPATYPWGLTALGGSGAGHQGATAAWEVDTRPLIRAVAEQAQRGVPAEVVARRFHNTLVEMLVEVVRQIAGATGLATVALSGGVFLNAWLLGQVLRRLDGAGLAVYRQQKVPCNDAGLALGQLAVAAARVTGGARLPADADVPRPREASSPQP
jgi:hydrogenase maturation protein HypF